LRTSSETLSPTLSIAARPSPPPRHHHHHKHHHSLPPLHYTTHSLTGNPLLTTITTHLTLITHYSLAITITHLLIPMTFSCQVALSPVSVKQFTWVLGPSNGFSVPTVMYFRRMM
jgi:hypothetical protein